MKPKPEEVTEATEGDDTRQDNTHQGKTTLYIHTQGDQINKDSWHTLLKWVLL